MTEQTYVLIYNRPAHFDPAKLHTYIQTQLKPSDWWHFLESAYIFVSSKSLVDLQTDFLGHFNGMFFIILPIEVGTSAGWLPKEAWEWLNSRKKKHLPR